MSRLTPEKRLIERYDGFGRGGRGVETLAGMLNVLLCNGGKRGFARRNQSSSVSAFKLCIGNNPANLRQVMDFFDMCPRSACHCRYA